MAAAHSPNFFTANGYVMPRTMPDRNTNISAPVIAPTACSVRYEYGPPISMWVITTARMMNPRNRSSRRSRPGLPSSG